jgi:hypothetical protein
MMDDAPLLDDADGFDPRRVRFADVDGSGPADLLYLGDTAVRYWPNQAGNGWGPTTVLTTQPTPTATVSVDVMDLLGHGTQCLVFSSDDPVAPGSETRPPPFRRRSARARPDRHC